MKKQAINSNKRQTVSDFKKNALRMFSYSEKEWKDISVLRRDIRSCVLHNSLMFAEGLMDKYDLNRARRQKMVFQKGKTAYYGSIRKTCLPCSNPTRGLTGYVGEKAFWAYSEKKVEEMMEFFQGHQSGSR